jgi:hypothetical protein
MDGSFPYPPSLLRAPHTRRLRGQSRNLRSDQSVGTGEPTHDSARLAIMLASALAIMSAAAAAEKFQKLSGAQIRAKLAGMEITDEVHWADVYGRDGTLMTFSMGKKTIQWSVKNDELCQERGKDFQGCYQVWMAGKKIELRREGSSLLLESVLQPPTKRQ